MAKSMKMDMKPTKTKRPDGRMADELREMDAKIGVVPRADGSAMFTCGKTIALAAVYGPRELHPKFLQNPQKGVLRCNYNMLSFSGSGERVRPGPSRRSKEISMVIEKALLPVLNMEQYPNAVIDIFVELIQTDAGTRCAGINAAARAVADSGIPMKDLVAALAVGVVNGQVAADLTKEEEDLDGAVDIATAIQPNAGEFTLIQMDGKINKEHFVEALELAKNVSKKITEVQTRALKERYQL